MRTTRVIQRDTAQAAAKAGDGRVHVDLHHLLRLRHQATGYSFLPRQPVHSLLTGRYASRLRGRGLNFEEIRRYLPGDDVRNMDWKVTARTRRPHVRVYTEERDRAVLLLVDQRTHMFFGSRDRMKSVVAAEIAALAAWRVLDQGDRVGAVIFSDQRTEEIRPHRSMATVMQMLNAVAEMNQALPADADPDPGRLNRVLEKAARTAKHDHLVVVASDFLGADDDTARWTARIAEHNDMLAFLVFDPLRAEAPSASGRGVVTDGRQQIELDLGDRKIWRRVAAQYQGELEEKQAALRKLSAPLIPISTEGEVVEQVRRLIGSRGR